MDARDIEILKAISDLGEPSPKVIEEETGIPKSTVHYRVEKLREQGVIEDNLYNIDLGALSLNLTVISEVTARYDEGYQEIVGEKLSNIEGVNQVYFTMGDTDFIVIAHVAEREMVEDLIQAYERIEEVERTSSRFVISTIKNQFAPLRDFELETLIELGTENGE
ncbi:DNA-binding transcriptional regulator, Lrp family [Haladaptatus litoreus]|uniref:DNA-binding transcriptional regulator, Lrp family n=1 Tax=Haladaptatus litoreus TaxID=553468 RepID=A0A1N7CHM9_9EURY|nr:Lrp/AsnC family transcriptional regulator [Haladaptatus litoreus]SIR63023.1 DNA-binding transcriptional regulator, Lrp family [Haladaptatus litoreus]